MLIVHSLPIFSEGCEKGTFGHIDEKRFEFIKFIKSIDKGHFFCYIILVSMIYRMLSVLPNNNILEEQK